MFFKNYDKPGPGIQPRNPDEPRIKIFWDIFPRKLCNLFKLNLLYLLVSVPFFLVTMVVAGVISLPVITSAASELTAVQVNGYDILIRFLVAFLFMIFAGLGPATAGFSYIIREYADECPCWLIGDFFEKLKSNFKQSILLWLIDLAVFYVLTVAFSFYGQTQNTIFQYIILVMILVYMMMHTYIYQMMITFDLPLKHILKNSLLLAMGKAPSSLIILICNILIYAVLPCVVILSKAGLLTTLIILLAEIFLFPSITNFITVFYITPMIRKYIGNEEK